MLQALNDLIKPQWRIILELIKRCGSQNIADLSRVCGYSYMAAKSNCEALRKLGYLVKIRISHHEIGRPEIFYKLAPKADCLFLNEVTDMTEFLLSEIKLFGAAMPKKVLLQYFNYLQKKAKKFLQDSASDEERFVALVNWRNDLGCVCFYQNLGEGVIEIIESHNPLTRVFELYPYAINLETRMLEALLRTKIDRSTVSNPHDSSAQVRFILDGKPAKK